MPAQTETPPFAEGDLVEIIATGEEWEVEAYVPATPYKPALVVLVRDESGPGWVRGICRDAEIGQVRMKTRGIERCWYGWETRLVAWQVRGELPV